MPPAQRQARRVAAATACPARTATSTSSRLPPTRSTGASGPDTCPMARLASGTPPKGHVQRSSSASVQVPARASQRPRPGGAAAIAGAEHPRVGRAGDDVARRGERGHPDERRHEAAHRHEPAAAEPDLGRLVGDQPVEARRGRRRRAARTRTAAATGRAARRSPTQAAASFRRSGRVGTGGMMAATETAPGSAAMAAASSSGSSDASSAIKGSSPVGPDEVAVDHEVAALGAHGDVHRELVGADRIEEPDGVVADLGRRRAVHHDRRAVLEPALLLDDERPRRVAPRRPAPRPRAG